MSIQPIKQSNGVSRATAICDDCAREEIVACGYLHTGNPHSPSQPNQSQARSKVISLGWSFIKGKLRCSACTAFRKVVKMPRKSVEKAAPLREMTKKQRLEIMSMLLEVYDLDAERYTGGDTDSTVADVLGVMAGWVARVREDEFGPDGVNEDIEALVAELDEWRAGAQKTLKASTEQNARLIAEMDAAKGFCEKLTRIRKSVGPHVLKRAGV